MRCCQLLLLSLPNGTQICTSVSVWKCRKWAGFNACPADSRVVYLKSWQHPQTALSLSFTLRLQIFSCSLPEVKLQNLDSLPCLPHFKPHLPNHILDCHPFQIVPCGQPAGWKYRPLNVFKISWTHFNANHAVAMPPSQCLVVVRGLSGAWSINMFTYFHIFSLCNRRNRPILSELGSFYRKFKMLPFSGAVLHHPKACPQKIEWKFVAWTSSSWQAFYFQLRYTNIMKHIMKNIHIHIIYIYVCMKSLEISDFSKALLVWNFTTRSAGVVASWGAQAVDALAQ